MFGLAGGPAANEAEPGANPRSSTALSAAKTRGYLKENILIQISPRSLANASNHLPTTARPTPLAEDLEISGLATPPVYCVCAGESKKATSCPVAGSKLASQLFLLLEQKPLGRLCCRFAAAEMLTSVSSLPQTLSSNVDFALDNINTV